MGYVTTGDIIEFPTSVTSNVGEPSWVGPNCVVMSTWVSRRWYQKFILCGQGAGAAHH